MTALTRRSFVALTLGAIAPSISSARTGEKSARIANLTGSSQAAHAPLLAAFRAGMQDLGYVEGRHYSVDALCRRPLRAARRPRR